MGRRLKEMSEEVLELKGWDLKLYRELLDGRDRTVDSIRAQMTIQNHEKIEFARKVVKLFDEIFDIEHLRQSGEKAITELYDLANEILAEE